MFIAKSTKDAEVLLHRIVAKHAPGKHDQKTHGKGGKGGGGGGSSESVPGIGIGAFNEREELQGLASRTNDESMAIDNDLEDVETELMNSGFKTTDSEMKAVRTARKEIRSAQSSFDRAKKTRDLGEKRKLLETGYKRLGRAFNQDIPNTNSESISMLMEDIGAALGIEGA